MSELTPNLQLVKPTINGEDTENTWGYDLNANFDILDDAIGSAKFSDGDKGDIVVSAQGELWTFDPTVVTPAGRGVIAVDAQSGLLEQNGATAFKKRGITVHQQPPSGGADGDLWLQYNLALPPEVNWNVSSAYFNTRTEASQSDIPGPVKTIQTGGFATPGVGEGTYARMNAVPTDLANPAFFRSVDRNKADGGQDPTLGGYWQLMPQGGIVYIEQFGGKADWNGSTGTDNLQPLLYAMALPARVSGDVKPTLCIQFGAGQYWFSTTIEIRNPTWMRGLGSSFDTQGIGEPTQLVFPNATCCIRVYTRGQQGVTGSGSALPGTGAGSTIEGFGITQLGVPVYTADKHGIHLRATAAIKNCTFYNICGDGIRIATAAFGGGNANRWQIRDVQVQKCMGHGLAIMGGDSNAGTAVNFYTKQCGKCGIFENETFGNEFFGLELDGYGDGGVSHLGKRYQLVSLDAAFAVPGTDRNHWYYLYDGAPSAQFPAWDAGHSYGQDDLKLPLFASGFSTKSLYAGMYVEGSAVLSHIGNSPAMAVQTGQAHFTNNSTTLDVAGTSRAPLGCPTGFLGFRTFSGGDPGYAFHGASVGAGIGGNASSGGAGADSSMDLLVFSAAADGGPLAANWSSKHDFEWRWLNSPDLIVSGITGPRTTTGLGRNSGAQFKFYAHDIGLVDATDPSIGGRLLGLRNVVPTGAGEYARGERYYNASPVAGGFEGWVCVTSGVIGGVAWVSGTTYAGGNMVINAGNVYRNQTYATSTSPPTHTSGVQTYPDGLTWTYMGPNTPPVFKTFGSIAA